MPIQKELIIRLTDEATKMKLEVSALDSPAGRAIVLTQGANKVTVAIPLGMVGEVIDAIDEVFNSLSSIAVDDANLQE